ncbi:response regulator [Catenovulum sp. SM1970]|uniref:FIST N-terminal domain-containing protein n=1 Tax=Marinifaba aquimaris TaxID=2741323 RepID=UPI0015724EE6|nr:FIST N-terminal domain-containing protein [Marinifaba aquimaris]NTS76831.1 response regulator [Marinifaba aquimaris]
MHTWTFQYQSNSHFTQQLEELDILSQVHGYTCLIQVFSGVIQSHHNLQITRLLRGFFPDAHIIGMTTAGEIFQGQAQSLTSIISITIFEHTCLHFHLIQQTESNQSCEQQLHSILNNTPDKLAGVLLLTTPLTVNSDQAMRMILAAKTDSVLFGGGAGDNGAMLESFLFDEKGYHDQAIAVVMFEGEQLSIFPHAHLDWQPVGRKMTITKTQGQCIEEVDHKPAIDIYKNYLGIKDFEDSFFAEALEFPLLIEKGNTTLARVPVSTNENGGLSFISDVKTGDTVQLGFGNVDWIKQSSLQRFDQYSHQKIESFFVYSCGCRRFFLQEGTSIESADLEKIAPTVGFFTAGEFFNHNQNKDMLNLAFTCVGMTEKNQNQNHNVIEKPTMAFQQKSLLPSSSDYYAEKHVRVLKKLTNLLNIATQEIENSLDSANQASQAKGRFLANISHEIRTPLTSVMGYAERLLEKDVDQDTLQNAADKIITNAEFVKDIINDVLDFSKMEANQLEVHNTEVSTCKLLHDILNLIEPQIQNPDVSFELDLDFPLPAKILVDDVRLKQVVLNLLSNAIKFTNQGKIKLSVKYQASTLSLAVQDTGIGMTESQIERLFKPFEQADLSTTRQYGGTGLGLSISKQLSKMMQGDIKVQSLVDLGSCFTFYCQAPALNDEQLNQAIWLEQQEQMQHPTAEEFNVNAKVLLVEDHQDNQALFKEVFELHGLSVETADDGEQAVEQALAEHFDMIFMDVQMPKMDGISATQLLRATGLDTPIIALTANVMSHEIAEYLAAGFSDHLAKPLKQNELSQVLSKHLAMDIDQQPDIQIDIGEYADKYSQQLTADIDAMQMALAQNDMTAMSKHAHRIKGSAASFGMPTVAQLAGEIEELANAGHVNAIAAPLNLLSELADDDL